MGPLVRAIIRYHGLRFEGYIFKKKTREEKLDYFDSGLYEKKKIPSKCTLTISLAFPSTRSQVIGELGRNEHG